MEGAIFGFKKDISTTEAAAMQSARQTADAQVKRREDLGHDAGGPPRAALQETARRPARLSGVSEADACSPSVACRRRR